VRTSIAPFVAAYAEPPGNETPCESRRNIHDPPTIVNQGQELLGQEVDSFEMNIDHRIKIRLGHLLVATKLDRFLPDLWL
jgi:hypothetical protein